MDSSGKINELGKQYIGLASAGGSVNVAAGRILSKLSMIFAAVAMMIGTFAGLF